MHHSAHFLVIIYFALIWTLLATPVTQDEPTAVLASASWAVPASQITLVQHHA